MNSTDLPFRAGISAVWPITLPFFHARKFMPISKSFFTQLDRLRYLVAEGPERQLGRKIVIHLQEEGKIIGFAATYIKRLSVFIGFDDTLIHNYIINTCLCLLLQYWHILIIMNV